MRLNIMAAAALFVCVNAGAQDFFSWEFGMPEPAARESKVKFLYEAGEIQVRGKAFHFCECEITFLELLDLIKFINFVGRIEIGLDSITMLEAELKRYNKYPEYPDVQDRLKD